jgi:hypothetical protein
LSSTAISSQGIFQAEIKAFEIKNPIPYIINFLPVYGVPKVYADDAKPWDNELAELLKPLNLIQWSKKDKSVNVI